MRSDHEKTHGREHLSRCLSHPTTLSSFWETQIHITPSFGTPPFSALTRVSKHSTLSQSDNSHKPWIMLRLHRPHRFCVDSQLEQFNKKSTCSNVQNFTHHGLRSNFVSSSAPWWHPGRPNMSHRLDCLGLLNYQC